jgi:hypothetical protein
MNCLLGNLCPAAGIDDYEIRFLQKTGIGCKTAI